MRKQTILIADKDSCFREQLRKEIERLQYPAVFWECCNGLEAVKYINALQPDVAFINVSLPGIGGFDVLDMVSHHPIAILLSDCTTDAVRAFEYEAVGYLLKPISSTQLQRTIQRLNDLSKNLDNTSMSPHNDYPSRIFVEKGNCLTKIDVTKITHLKADKDYTWIYTHDGAAYLSTHGIGHLTQKMDPKRFMRIHRSYIVNLDYVQKLYKDISKIFVTLPNDIEINVGKNYMPVIKSMMF